jgi:hypothetical protein
MMTAAYPTRAEEIQDLEDKIRRFTQLNPDAQK